MGLLLQQSNLESALSPLVVVALFDDTSTGVPSATAMAEVIAQAEAEVFSYLVGHYPTNPPPASLLTDPLIQRAAVDFAIVFAYERHPEYTRSQGETSRVETRFKRACDRMKRIQAAMQQPAQTNSPTPVTSSTVGGAGPAAEPLITLGGTSDF